MSGYTTLSGEKVILRRTLPQDDSFLFQVYASTRLDEMALVSWSEEQKLAFLQMQFNAQRQHYLSYYPQAEYCLICLQDDRPIGRIIIDRSGDKILLMDIALLPEYRNSGIGTRLIREIMDEAQATGLPVRLHVEIFNRALRLYERLGFIEIDKSGFYLEMEWLPAISEVDHNQKIEGDINDARDTL